MIFSGHSPAIEKACPVVLRHTKGPRKILSFAHPIAGQQFIKGTVEAGETAAAAAVRELHGEAGITAQKPAIALGSSNAIQPGETWHFFVMQIHPLPDSWQHQTADDDGQLFRFFWHLLRQPLSDRFERREHRVLQYICRGLA